MKLADLYDGVETIPTNRGYWFVRTDTGFNFDAFTQDNFIGIGWNEVSTDDLEQKSPFEVKKIIAKKSGVDIESTYGKTITTGGYNKLLLFKNLKKGDFVVVPSRGSSRLAFGIIKDSKVYSEIDPDKLARCDYRKRRKIQWVVIKNLHELDHIFYRIIRSMHAITDIKKYENYIDNVNEVLYEKEGYTHFVLDIKTKDQINIDYLVQLMDAIKFISKKINDEFDTGDKEGESPLIIRLNVQSPGKIELRRIIGKSIVLLALMFNSCKNGEPVKHGNQQVDIFVNLHIDTLRKIEKAMDELEIDREKINLK